jgi:hypothetical protein
MTYRNRALGKYLSYVIERELSFATVSFWGVLTVVARGEASFA